MQVLYSESQELRAQLHITQGDLQRLQHDYDQLQSQKERLASTVEESKSTIASLEAAKDAALRSVAAKVRLCDTVPQDMLTDTVSMKGEECHRQHEIVIQLQRTCQTLADEADRRDAQFRTQTDK